MPVSDEQWQEGVKKDYKTSESFNGDRKPILGFLKSEHPKAYSLKELVPRVEPLEEVSIPDEVKEDHDVIMPEVKRSLVVLEKKNQIESKDMRTNFYRFSK